jgi:hypothetical protein
VIAYNASFERRCIQDLAEACLEWAEALLDIADRLVDLLLVTRAHYYERATRQLVDQGGSADHRARARLRGDRGRRWSCRTDRLA